MSDLRDLIRLMAEKIEELKAERDALLPVARAAADWERAERYRCGTEWAEIEWVGAIAALRAAVRAAGER